MKNEDLIEMIQVSDSNEIQLKRKNAKTNKKPEGEIAYIFLSLGLILLALAIFHANNISAVIGIALTFWGALLLYIKPTRYIRKEILEIIIDEANNNLDIFYDYTNFQGIPFYYSPPTLSGLKNAFIIIPKLDSLPMPSDEQLSEKKYFYETNSIIKLVPLGYKILEIYDFKLTGNLSSFNINIIKNYIENILINNYEVAKSIEIEYNEPLIKVFITEYILSTEIIKIKNKHFLKYIGDPFISLIACILTISTHKKIIIKNIDINTTNKNLMVIFEIQNK